MNDIRYHAQDYNNIVHPPIFWMCDKFLYTFLYTNVLNMLNPSCTGYSDQDMLIEVDTSDELCFLTCLASTPHQSTLKWATNYCGVGSARESTVFLLTILVSVLIPVGILWGTTPIYSTRICSQS